MKLTECSGFPAFGIVLAAAVIAILVACDQNLKSPEMTEAATVEDTIFMPSQHGSSLGMNLDDGSLQASSVTLKEKFAIVFKCEHGKFVIQGEGERYKTLWQKLSKGDAVTVRYHELWRVREGVTNVVGYDFVDASVMK